MLGWFFFSISVKFIYTISFRQLIKGDPSLLRVHRATHRLRYREDGEEEKEKEEEE